jgi:molybdopterin molybdotransferase
VSDTSSPRPRPQTLEFEEARQNVIQTLRSFVGNIKTELISLQDAHSRTLAETVRAERDYPALARSLRDGYALKAQDLPGTLVVRGEVRAGDQEQPALLASEALEIMTGAPVPPGADAVVMLEHVSRTGGQVKIDRPAEVGQFINQRGAEATAGDVLIPAHTKLDSSHIAVLAACGQTVVPVLAKPRVAILATGDEIVALEDQPAPHQIRNSNSYMLAALVGATGAEPVILPIARDTNDALVPLLKEGLAYDCLIVTGGVSAGKYDLVKPALRDLGVEFQFERVRIQPGQPAAFGVANGKPVFGLPGNPGSSLVTFLLFARPALELLGGASDSILPLLSACLEAPFRHKGGLTRFLPARLNADGHHLRHISWQGSSDIPALARANCFLVADHDRENWAVGDSIRVMLKV